jgi:hypothetical protein
MRLPLLLLALAACAGPNSPSQLHKGTVTAPPPPQLRPGHGAPVVGQPGHERPRLPPSPHKRVLPPSREPGIWASGASSGAPAPTILSVPLTLPDGKTQEDWAPTISCAQRMSLAATRALGAGAEARLGRARACVAAMAQRECLRRVEERLRERATEQGRSVDVDTVRRLRNAIGAANKDVATHCATVALEPDVRAPLDAILRADSAR